MTVPNRIVEASRRECDMVFMFCPLQSHFRTIRTTDSRQGNDAVRRISPRCALYFSHISSKCACALKWQGEGIPCVSDVGEGLARLHELERELAGPAADRRVEHLDGER